MKQKKVHNWEVLITPVRNYYGSDKLKVCLCRKGSNHIVFCELAIGDEDFDEQITTMKAEAEERAGSLNAVGAE